MTLFTSTTAKYALRKMLGTTNATDIDIGVQALADDVDTNMAGWSTNTQTNRPAAAKAGRIFRGTDTTQVYLDTGSAWVEIHIDLAGDLKSTARASSYPGWLLCDGSAVSRTTYADLFAAIGSTYGAGNGSTTFNVPDLRGRVPIGVDGTAGRLSANDALGNSAGAETVVLIPAQGPLRAHTHTPASAGGWVTVDATSAIPDAAALHGNGGDGLSTGNQDTYATGGVTGGQVDGDPHPNMPPYQIVNWVVKT